MTRYLSGIVAALIALSVINLGSSPAIAAPIQPVPLVAPDNSASAMEVQYRRRHYRSHRHHRRDNAGAIIGGLAAAAIIGGIIASEAAPRRYERAGNAHVDWCFNRYRSYDVRSDTYQPHHGPRRYCNSPYN